MLKLLKRFIEINDLLNERNFHDGDFEIFEFEKIKVSSTEVVEISFVK